MTDPGGPYSLEALEKAARFYGARCRFVDVLRARLTSASSDATLGIGANEFPQDQAGKAGGSYRS